ncbi:hypothetical protein FNQ90_00875 [Streptomyces alkaliphilus]|uniref:Uncharacterized protein n=1 Tax=Streptomyces alkaliphilus TaxID=1472722 RepID=A0A7W3XZW2_9ACTN|nr:hypothetical protein [Streptomyces alkaliphilus]MBB0242696.1 hypothetical protein [Streptomyces alkaliphilus]
MAWQGSIEHPNLYATAVSIVDTLRGISGRLQHGDTQYMVHTDLAIRCRSLALYFESAISNAERDAYAPALGSLRSAFEHVFIDQLVFLGQRYVQVFRDVDEETWIEWQRQREAGERWTDVTDWSRSKGGIVRITREGLHSRSSEGGSRQTIGIHYFLLNEYSPFVGPPNIQQHFDDGLSEVMEREDEAKRHRYMHDTYLKWQSIKDSLKTNGFADDETLRRMDVHYRFLSAFVHPNTDAAQLLYGRNAWDWPVYDHYSSELTLLYAVVLAVKELRSFYAMTQRPPMVGISNWVEIERLCDKAWSLSSHFWFPGHEPHEYDRFQEANRRGFRGWRSGCRSVENPATLPTEEIGYYVNPLERLVRLHSSQSEMITGLTYRSPWHRSDAQFR